jgi:hypothetical protein
VSTVTRAWYGREEALRGSLSTSQSTTVRIAIEMIEDPDVLSEIEFEFLGRVWTAVTPHDSLFDSITPFETSCVGRTKRWLPSDTWADVK